MKGVKIGVGICGSFCTHEEVLRQVEALAAQGADVWPILSFASANTDTRFGTAAELKERLTAICGRKPIETIVEAEPIGPKRLLDIVAVAPATGNTVAKLAAGIADTPVTLACKSQLRNGGPVLLAVSTNDALGANAKNIGVLLARKNVFFVPMGQDDPEKKPASMIADFSLLAGAAREALAGRQLQPVLR